MIGFVLTFCLSIILIGSGAGIAGVPMLLLTLKCMGFGAGAGLFLAWLKSHQLAGQNASAQLFNDPYHA